MGTLVDTLLQAKSDAPGSSLITIVNGPVASTGYKIDNEGVDIGGVSWDQYWSGVRGTQGARLAGADAQNRDVTFRIQCVGSTTDNLASLISTLADLDAEMRRFGGTIIWKPQSGSFKLYFDVMASKGLLVPFDRPFQDNHFARATWVLSCGPYMLGDPFDILDTFDTDTSGDYTKDADGALLTVKGGQLVPGQTGTSRWRHTGRGYSYGDQEATLKVTTGSTVTNLSVDLFICSQGTAETFFSAQLQGGNLNVAKWVAGVNTWPATAAFALSANTTYWLRVRREGRRITAAVYTSEPTPLATPAATASYTMTNGENWQFVTGPAGFRIAVVSTGERYDDFRVEPFTYANNLLAPDERALRPIIPGDAPALADMRTTQSGGTAPPVWAVLGWWERPSVWNYVWNGDFEDDADGWSVAAVTGVTGAATSDARSTSAGRNKYGTASLQIVTPATANTGATFKINRRFYQGRDYILLLWASSAAQTTNARARLGVNGDIASSLPAALSTTPALHVALWTPTADRDGAYAAFEVTAATLTTMNIDGVVVIESRGAPITTDIDASQLTVVVDRIPDDWPTAPFLAVSSGTGGYEIFRVESINYTTRTLTITRALEGTTGIIHTTGNPIIPLPPIRGHLEGKGAQPPVGVIEAESDDTGNRFTWALTANAGARLGNYLQATGIGAAGSAASDILVDPHLLIPDDYTQGELAIEVWARLEIHAGLTNPVALLSAFPESGTVASGAATSNYGAIRYSEEFGTAGKPLIKPSSGAVGRVVRLGTLRFPVDRANPTRWRLQVRITWSAATAATVGFDYLVLVPAGQRAVSPSGKANDANYPRFIASTAETSKTVRSDGSGLVAKPPAAPAPDHGLGGNLIELPAGNVDWVAKLCDLVPDDPTVDASTEQAERPAGVFHVAVTPRWHLGRGA